MVAYEIFSYHRRGNSTVALQRVPPVCTADRGTYTAASTGNAGTTDSPSAERLLHITQTHLNNSHETHSLPLNSRRRAARLLPANTPGSTDLTRAGGAPLMQPSVSAGDFD